MDTDNKENCNECETEHHHGHSSSKMIFKIEKSMIKTAFYTLIFLSLIEIIAYYGFFKNIPNFFSKYGYYLIFLVISIVINSVAIWHIKAYKHVFSCTTGMMVGMTIGMTSGFSIGLIVGATNGMFIGSLAGIIIGMIVGGYVGNCCGIMGIMEGIMAGLMGGLMGAMTSIMTLNDNLAIFVPILMISIVVIIVGLAIMIYEEEVKKRTDIHYHGFEFLPFITVNFIITLMLTFLMIYGPRSFLFG
ncbi:MAG: hypothetical protein AABX61_00605 [Nanoarchaeota archaeon]